MRGITAVMLVVGMAASFAGVQAFAVTAAEHPAGCHASVPIPSHVPTNFQCCANGHHWAIAGSVFSPQPHIELFGVTKCTQDFAVHSWLQQPASIVVPSSSPPRGMSLRI